MSFELHLPAGGIFVTAESQEQNAEPSANADSAGCALTQEMSDPSSASSSSSIANAQKSQQRVPNSLGLPTPSKAGFEDNASTALVDSFGDGMDGEGFAFASPVPFNPVDTLHAPRAQQARANTSVAASNKKSAQDTPKNGAKKSPQRHDEGDLHHSKAMPSTPKSQYPAKLANDVPSAAGNTAQHSHVAQYPSNIPRGKNPTVQSPATKIQYPQGPVNTSGQSSQLQEYTFNPTPSMPSQESQSLKHPRPQYPQYPQKRQKQLPPQQPQKLQQQLPPQYPQHAQQQLPSHHPQDGTSPQSTPSNFGNTQFRGTNQQQFTFSTANARGHATLVETYPSHAIPNPQLQSTAPQASRYPSSVPPVAHQSPPQVAAQPIQREAHAAGSSMPVLSVNNFTQANSVAFQDNTIAKQTTRISPGVVQFDSGAMDHVQQMNQARNDPLQAVPAKPSALAAYQRDERILCNFPREFLEAHIFSEGILSAADHSKRIGLYDQAVEMARTSISSAPEKYTKLFSEISISMALFMERQADLRNIWHKKLLLLQRQQEQQRQQQEQLQQLQQQQLQQQQNLQQLHQLRQKQEQEALQQEYKQRYRETVGHSQPPPEPVKETKANKQSKGKGVTNPELLPQQVVLLGTSEALSSSLQSYTSGQPAVPKKRKVGKPTAAVGSAANKKQKQKGSMAPPESPDEPLFQSSQQPEQPVVLTGVTEAPPLDDFVLPDISAPLLTAEEVMRYSDAFDPSNFGADGTWQLEDYLNLPDMSNLTALPDSSEFTF